MGASPKSDSADDSHGSALKLGLYDESDDFEEDDDLEKEYQHPEDTELLEY